MFLDIGQGKVEEYSGKFDSCIGYEHWRNNRVRYSRNISIWVCRNLFLGQATRVRYIRRCDLAEYVITRL